MTLNSKFEKDDAVWFIVKFPVTKIYEGVIKYVYEWNSSSGFNYSIEHINKEGIATQYFISEADIFSSKQDILENVFEENGVLAENPPEEPEDA